MLFEFEDFEDPGGHLDVGLRVMLFLYFGSIYSSIHFLLPLAMNKQGRNEVALAL